MSHVPLTSALLVCHSLIRHLFLIRHLVLTHPCRVSVPPAYRTSARLPIMLPTASLPAIRILRPTPCHWSLPPNSSESRGDQAPDPITLSNEFDRTNSVMDLVNQLERAGFTDLAIIPVTLHTVVEVAESLEKEMREKQHDGMDLVVFQLCDGTGNASSESNERIQIL